MSCGSVTGITNCGPIGPITTLKPTGKLRHENPQSHHSSGAAACVALFLGSLQAAARCCGRRYRSRCWIACSRTPRGSVLNMAFGNAARPPDFTNLGVSAAGISACTLTSVDGLCCLDGKNLTQVAQSAGARSVQAPHVLNCTDPALGFDTGLSPSCTGMTVDKSGAIWLSGKKRLPNNWPPRPWWIPEQTLDRAADLVQALQPGEGHEESRLLPWRRAEDTGRWCVLRRGNVQRPLPRHPALACRSGRESWSGWQSRISATSCSSLTAAPNRSRSRADGTAA